ncbi:MULTISPECIES: hypothetical protein [Kamptonema]|uniref:hypothetical protein n=1 Tax=Kamptonema TaxID=1501433 RepID=UPI0001DAC5AD|nr:MULTISPECIES: hypothetical protein [Kamptonema]CBN57338.1 conserved exported hypothetical protein [Kamptonema sp. PCC 6506]
MPLELVILLAALIVSWLAFNWAIKVLKASLGTAVAIAAIVLVLQLVFGIGPNQLLQHIINLPQTLWQMVQGK